MADRQFHRPYVQGIKHVLLNFTVLPQGVGAPLMSEGDPNGSFVTCARTGVGTFNLVTKDKYLALVAAGCTGIILAAQAGNVQVGFGAPTSAGGIWTIPFTYYVAGVAADLAANANNRLCFELVFRNSGVLP